MVNALTRLSAIVVGWLQEILELLGVAAIAAGVGLLTESVAWVLIVVGAALLLKSLEVDLLSRGEP